MAYIKRTTRTDETVEVEYFIQQANIIAPQQENKPSKDYGGL